MVRFAVFGSTCAAILVGVGFIPAPEVSEFSMPEISLPEQPKFMADLGALRVDLPELGARIEERLTRTDVKPVVTDTPVLPKTPTAIQRTAPAMAANTVNFELDDAALDDEARAQLKELAGWLRANPSTNIGIYGHTDLTGPADYNDALGQLRADTVASFLMDTGVEAERIDVILSFGESDPLIATDKTSRDNRRVLVEEM